MELQSGANLAA